MKLPFSNHSNLLRNTLGCILVTSFACVGVEAHGSDALLRHATPSITTVQKFVKDNATPDGVYILVDNSITPAVKYLAVTHDRWLFNSVFSKTSVSLLSSDKLSLAPGLQVHVVTVKPAGSPQYTFTNASTATAQPGQSAQATTSSTTTTSSTGDVITTGSLTPSTTTTGTEYTRPDLLTPATGSLSIAVGKEKFVITKAPSWDWSAAFSPTFICPFGQSPEYGVTTLAVPFGTNSNVTIDTVGAFTTGSTSSTTLGEAISYGSVIGSSYINSGRDVFGFAVQFKISFGITGLNLSNHSFGTTPFVAVGFSIPFKTKS